MTQFDFSSYDVKGREAWYTLPIEGVVDPETGEPKPAQVLCRCATSANKPYFSELARILSKTQRGNRRPEAAVEEELGRDRVLFPRHVVIGMRGIPDAKGVEVPNSMENRQGLLKALPDWIMRNLSVFCANPANFLGEDDPDDVDIDETAGN